MIVKVLECPHCSGENLVKNGHAPNGKQKYLCNDCGGSTRENPSHNGYTEKEKETILKTYEERASLRGLQRIYGVAPGTVSRWLKKKQNESKA